ncbi:MAG TPA: DUF6781 family protein [Ideonella sp.]|uniref:DUF6781 family protein n=1 Tax=Ideonella sp. TaxID=1929293 RepID=UPI002E3477E2|nr:DUF6781 family protein [Ideonella sp.]HEX5682694.1 DUF6781 family protein [Ideonella sp.]
MPKSGIDQDALIEMFASASAKQTAQLREAVSQATLKALQGREMSLKNIKAVLKSVTEAASTGALQNVTPKVDVEAMLNGALAGMDDALLKAVDANRVALERLVDQGVDLQEKQLKKALDDLEKLEDTMFDTVRKATAGADMAKLAGPWAEVLGKFEQSGSLTGAQANATLEQMTSQMQTAMRQSRAAGLKAAQTLAQSYAALVSGVLMGMSDALRQGGGDDAAPASKAPGKSGRK